MAHFEDISIGGLRGLFDVEFNGFADATLLVGANNSGKTTVLEAIEIACDPVNPGTWIDVAWRRETKSSRIPVIEHVEWLFPRTTGVVELASDSLTTRRLRARAEELDSRSLVQEDLDEPSDDGMSIAVDPAPQRGLGVEVDVLHRDSLFNDDAFLDEFDTRLRFDVWERERLAFRRPSPDRPRVPTVHVAPYSHRFDPIQNRLLTSAVRARSDAIVALLQRLDPNIEGLDLVSPEGVRAAIELRHATLGRVPLSAMGDGVRRAIALALSAIGAAGGILLIDEIETALHVDALERVFGWLREICTELDVQLVATTHSLEALDAMTFVDGPSELTCFRIECEDAKSAPVHHVTRFDAEELRRIRGEQGSDVR